MFEEARALVSEDAESTLVRMVTGHLGCPMTQVPTVTARFEGREHANVHRGIEAYVAEHSPEAEWHGISGNKMHMSVVDMLGAQQQHFSFELGAVDYMTVATGPDTTIDAVQLGLIATVAPDGSPVVVAVQGPHEERGDFRCTLQVLAASREASTAVREAVERHMREHDVFRGQVMAFGISEHRGNQLLTFLPRPALRPSDVVLPDGVLDSIERHVVRTASQSDRLRAHGQHLKRGLLLYGPPGTGKTHTVRYLMGRLESSTVLVLSGVAMLRYLRAATSLARRLAPSVIVVEDVDLIAQDRSHTRDGNPVLFELLNEMDGIGSEADVTFVLTTNRVDVMEKALSERPGRIDLAMQVPLPDADGRERLLRLYAAGTELDLPDASAIVAASEGVTASFVKELVRRATLRALDDQPGAARVRLDEAAISAALADLLDEKQALTRSLLGG
ncbi:AAA family ATPase [Lentzea flava]|uniref:AAA family ATPase n=1 Tax=Lentzea flava TaxID=103732 RepID=UPI001E3A0045|nr:ATP-binding protein [Lentzea flava]